MKKISTYHDIQLRITQKTHGILIFGAFILEHVSEIMVDICNNNYINMLCLYIIMVAIINILFEQMFVSNILQVGR